MINENGGPLLANLIAQTIRTADGNHDKGAGELSEHIATAVVNSKWLAETLASVWEDGRRTGSSRAMRYMSDEPGLDINDFKNPFL